MILELVLVASPATGDAAGRRATAFAEGAATAEEDVLVTAKEGGIEEIEAGSARGGGVYAGIAVIVAAAVAAASARRLSCASIASRSI